MLPAQPHAMARYMKSCRTHNEPPHHLWRMAAGLALLLIASGCASLTHDDPTPTPVPASPISYAYSYGVGDRLSWQVQGRGWIPTPELLKQLGLPGSGSLLGAWLSDKWQPYWITGIQQDLDHGYIPVLFHYYFGNLASRGVDAWPYVRKHETQYLNNVRKLGEYLKTLKGTVLVVLEPEYNVPGVRDRPAFGRLLARAVGILRETTRGSAVSLKIGVLVGDFGAYQGRIRDVSAWRTFYPSLSVVAPRLDFIAFEEMRGATHLDRHGHMKIYTPRQQGVDLLPQRVLAFSAYLQQTYHKPILLGYLAVSTYVPPGRAEDWPAAAAAAYRGVLQEQALLQQQGVFGVMAILLFDDMAHNKDGRDYFGDASDYFGLFGSQARSGVDKLVEPFVAKSTGKVWLEYTR